MKRIVVTGAAGFLGQAVLAALSGHSAEISVSAIDCTPPIVPDARFKAVSADLTAPGSMTELIGEPDIVLHLAAMPGGAAESDPDSSRRVNLDLPIAIIDHLTRLAGRPRLVLASSIAVFGAPLPGHVDDTTLPLPALTYGAHKLMSEVALADAVRRGSIEGVALRLPGLVARPGGSTGLRSAFMTEIFHACVNAKEYTLPVSRDATVWVMSARVAARNIMHAAFASLPFGNRVAMTLPAIRTTMHALVGAIVAKTGGSASIGYEPDAALEAQFGALPPLFAELALSMGYRADSSIDDLVAMALEDIRGFSPTRSPVDA